MPGRRPRGRGRGQGRGGGSPPPPWVVWHVSQPRWMNLSLPEEVARILDVRKGDLTGLVGPARGLAAIDWAPGTVRIVNVRTQAALVGRETRRNRVLALLPLNRKLMFRLPQAVARFLDVSTFPRGRTGRTTTDVVAWVLPEDDYADFRALERDGRAWRPPWREDFPHVFLVKAHFPHLRPTLHDLERVRESG